MKNICLNERGAEVILTKDQLDAIVTVDLNIKKLESILASTDYIHAWPKLGLGIKHANGKSSVVPLWFATAIESEPGLRNCRGFLNGNNEHTEIVVRGEVAKDEIERTRKLREDLIATFDKMNNAG